jgi:hypothetical protein
LPSRIVLRLSSGAMNRMRRRPFGSFAMLAKVHLPFRYVCLSSLPLAHSSLCRFLRLWLTSEDVTRKVIEGDSERPRESERGVQLGKAPALLPIFERGDGNPCRVRQFGLTEARTVPQCLQSLSHRFGPSAHGLPLSGFSLSLIVSQSALSVK